MTALRCQGCGQEIPADSPAPFRCPNAGTDAGDHVVGRSLAASAGAELPLDGSRNPFVRYRALTLAHALATSRGMSDAAFVAMVGELDEAVARAGGHGFEITPFARSEGLSDVLGLNHRARSSFPQTSPPDPLSLPRPADARSELLRVPGQGEGEGKEKRGTSGSPLSLARPSHHHVPEGNGPGQGEGGRGGEVCGELADLAGVWVKDETHNVSGSHKGRHLMGLAILGEVHARTGIAGAGSRLAIASCGNAALAAAVVARAWERPLDVFIPADANPRVVAELTRLGAAIHVCARVEGVAGDPCYHAFREAVAGGALPFCCQGSDNGLTVEGGETLAWEIASDLAREGRSLDRLFVQVGGGALASACVQGFRDAARLGLPVAMPRLHPVQTRGAFPLRRAWERVVARLAPQLGLDAQAGDTVVAERLREHAGSREVEAELDHAARHRAEFMWPWETEPRSVAHGILDDETYDWLAVVRGTLESGGFPVVVGEARLLEANALGRECTGIDVDPTGSAGLAGLLELREGGALGPREAVAVLFTGVKR